MISLTETAALKIKQQIDKRGKGLGVRVGVKTTGCSGLAYVLEFVDQPKNDDIEIKSNYFSVYVDPKSMPYLKGLTMDYMKKGLNEGFEFMNPNESSRCGCGESFTI